MIDHLLLGLEPLRPAGTTDFRVELPAQFILERRVSKAAQQLIFSTDSIEQIAERLGFLDRFHFSRMFKARMGTPPATYRKTAPRY